MQFNAALSLANAWIQAAEPRLVIDKARTITRPYGWVFCFRPAPDQGGLTGGPAFLIIDRVNGNVHAFGTGSLLEFVLVGYEQAIPPFRLTMDPEFPPEPGDNRGFIIAIDPHKPVDPSHFPEPYAATWRHLAKSAPVFSGV